MGMVGVLKEVWAGGIPKFDGVFRYDLPVIDDPGLVWSRKHLSAIPASGYDLEDPIVVTNNTTYNVVILTLKGDPGNTGANFRLRIYKNAVQQIDVPFTIVSPGTQDLAYATFLPPPNQISAVSVVTNDILTAKIVPDGGGDRRPYLREIVLALCHGTAVWQFDTAVPMGTYFAHKGL
jgi:hypothetical protein